MSFNAETPFDYDDAIRACAAGREEALSLIYQRDADRLFGIAMRVVRRRDLAEDVVHEAFVQIWTKAKTFDPARGAGRAWVATIVRNRALNVVRSGGRSGPLDQAALEAIPDCADDPAAALERLDDAERLKRCLSGLEENKRVSIMLAYVEGFSQTEIAARIGAPHNTVKTWIRRGLLALRECLQ